MKKLFYAHPDIVLAVLAAIFLGILVYFYSWAINDIYAELHRALVSSPAQTTGGFDLTDAAKLDLHGVTPGSSTPVAAPVSTTTISVAPSSTIATTTVSTSTVTSTPK